MQAKDGTALTPEQAAQFEAAGFLVLPQAVPDHWLRRLGSAAANIVEQFDIHRYRTVFTTADRDRGRDDYFFDSAEAVRCFLEEEALDASATLLKPKALAINKIGHALHDLVPEFRSFARQAFIADLLRGLGKMYIFKQPRIGGEVRWHQDATYLRTSPPSVTGLWVALEDATLDNGCLWVEPGGHRGPLREVYEVDWQRREGSLRTLDETPWPAAGDGQALEVPAGSIVLFHDHLPHYSSPNRSERSRQAFTLHFADTDARWSPRNWLQRPTLGEFRV